MAVEQPTRHECPICKGIVLNNPGTFQLHLSDFCAPKLFSLYPGLKGETFNALWYKLERMVKEQLIVAPAQRGAPATVYAACEPAVAQQYPATVRQRKNMDLEDLDRSIDLLQQREKQREHDRIQEKKRKRQEMEKEISAQVNQDEFTLSMPRLEQATQCKKRRLLYHNTSDIRPPKRLNIDPTISLDLLQHQIREARCNYHNVSYADFAARKDSPTKVDGHAALIHTQKALSRYLDHCHMLNNCFDSETFVTLSKQRMSARDTNCQNTMEAVLQEISFWQSAQVSSEPHEPCSSSPESQHDAHLWKSRNNVQNRGFDKSMFRGVKHNKYVKL